jgi:hypothetical protein
MTGAENFDRHAAHVVVAFLAAADGSCRDETAGE